MGLDVLLYRELDPAPDVEPLGQWRRAYHLDQLFCRYGEKQEMSLFLLEQTEIELCLESLHQALSFIEEAEADCHSHLLASALEGLNLGWDYGGLFGLTAEGEAYVQSLEEATTILNNAIYGDYPLYYHRSI